MDDDRLKHIKEMMHQYAEAITIREAISGAIGSLVKETKPDPFIGMMVSMAVMIMLMAERQGVDLDEKYCVILERLEILTKEEKS